MIRATKGSACALPFKQSKDMKHKRHSHPTQLALAEVQHRPVQNHPTSRLCAWQPVVTAGLPCSLKWGADPVAVTRPLACTTTASPVPLLPRRPALPPGRGLREASPSSAFCSTCTSCRLES